MVLRKQGLCHIKSRRLALFSMKKKKENKLQNKIQPGLSKAPAVGRTLLWQPCFKGQLCYFFCSCFVHASSDIKPLESLLLRRFGFKRGKATQRNLLANCSWWENQFLLYESLTSDSQVFDFFVLVCKSPPVSPIPSTRWTTALKPPIWNGNIIHLSANIMWKTDQMICLFTTQSRSRERKWESNWNKKPALLFFPQG